MAAARAAGCSSPRGAMESLAAAPAAWRGGGAGGGAARGAMAAAGAAGCSSPRVAMESLAAAPAVCGEGFAGSGPDMPDIGATGAGAEFAAAKFPAETLPREDWRLVDSALRSLVETAALRPPSPPRTKGCAFPWRLPLSTVVAAMPLTDRHSV